MADVSIDASVNTQTARGTRSVVFVSSGFFDSYSETNQVSTTSFAPISGVTQAGQAFAGQNTVLSGVKFYLNKNGSPTGNMRAYLYAATGTLGTNATATGSALATSGDIAIATLTASFVLTTFTFPTPYTLSSGSNYVIALEADLTDDSNYVRMGADNTSPTHAGNQAIKQAGSWSGGSAIDYCFYLNNNSGKIGYFFYVDSAGTFVYSKTTDGGATWGAAVTINSATTIVAYDVWYDQWTPSDTGALIHTWYFDVTNDIVRWKSLNTASDTQGTERVVFTGASAVAGRGAFVSGAKTRSGYLYCAYDIDAGAEKGLHRSTDSGTTWSASLSATFVEATLDTCKMYPASGTGDNNDCWAIYYDASATALTLKLWDSSAATATESATIQTHTDGATDLTGQFGFDASVRHSDGHLIMATLTQRDVAASAHQVYDITDTSTITTKTAIQASTDDHYYPQVFIDQNTDAIYVSYNGKRDGSEVMDTTTKVYYTKSTDGGSTWSAGDTAYMEGAAGVVQQVWNPISGPRFYVGWRVGTTLLGNAVNSVDVTPVAGGGAARRVFIMSA